ncbi:MAG: hypothetical protein ACLP62_10150 [Acidimicrobiales bacterium]
MAGFVGGATILIGVIATEMLVRFRERRRQITEAFTDLMFGTMEGILGDESAQERAQGELLMHAAHVGHLARWPLRNAKAIRDEVAAIQVRQIIAVARKSSGGPDLNLAEIVGPNISVLVTGTKGTRTKVNEALVAEGYPTVEQWGDPAAWRKGTTAGGGKKHE